jgi:hypothetical protein
MKTNWEVSRSESSYHFDHKRTDRAQDMLQYLGNIEPTWSQDIKDIIERVKPAPWTKGEGSQAPNKQEYDLIANGVHVCLPITHLSTHLTENLKRISDAFALDNCYSGIHVQRPGETWVLHIDKLHKWNFQHPETIMRIMIQLTDWQPGHFWQYGNYNYSQWQAGDVTTFDWANIPHATANAGFDPRVTLQLTGIRTDATMDFLSQLSVENNTNLDRTLCAA